MSSNNEALTGGHKRMRASLRSVLLHNYKSLEKVYVELAPLTVLVGPNGVGKSNFVDALAFVQECLDGSIEVAFKTRGGLGAVALQSRRRPRHIGVRLALDLPGQGEADYAFQIVPEADGGFRVSREQCEVRQFMGPSVVSRFEVRDGVFTKQIAGIRPQVSADRFALYAASATEEFRPVYDFLKGMRFYSILPQKLRELQEPDRGESLKRDGSNAAAVLKRLQDPKYSATYERLRALLSKVVAGIRTVKYRPVGRKETLEFEQDIGMRTFWKFGALNMSDGTLRVLGLLLAVYQPRTPTLMATEEPESTVHPALADLLLEVLLDAANECQILLTTHSPDLLDSKGLDDSQIRVVAMRRGKTLITPAAAHSRRAIAERLYTPGELLRLDELEPDIEVAEDTARRAKLFRSWRNRSEKTT